MDESFGTLPGRWSESEWLAQLARSGTERLRGHPHGDLPRWRVALEALPDVPTGAQLDRASPVLGSDANDMESLQKSLMELHPWRKGPLKLGGVTIDSEWRSDWKWSRLAPHVDLEGRRVLDIGCGNGYFGLRMLGAGARLVVGIDPTLLFVMQYLACRHFSGDIANYVLPLGIEDLPAGPASLDVVFSMGVLYHRRDPARHLGRIRSLLKGGGTLVLETLVLPQCRREGLLVPEDRYARMRNVWKIPGLDRLVHWVEEAGFRDIEVVDVTATTPLEQRSTPWMRFESLQQALDPFDPGRTVEGHPAPVRAVLVSRR